MKNLKQVFAAVLSVLILASCTKQASKELAPRNETKVEQSVKVFAVQMTEDQLAFEIGKPAASKIFEAKYGALVKRAKNATVTVFTSALNFDGVNLTGFIAPIKWIGVQNLTAVPITSLCNNYFAGIYGVGYTYTCSDSSPGIHRGWCTDMDDNVYLSDGVTI